VIDHEFPVGDSPSVTIGTRSGRIRVQAGEPGVVRVLVDTRDPTFEVTRRGDAILVSGERGGRADVTVHAPPMIDVEVSTASADVAVVIPVGRLEVASASGDVVFDTADRLQMKSASGAVRGNQVTGEARCVTASGDIRIGTLGERADLSTSSGDITIEQCRGSLSAATLSGDIRVGRHTGPDLNAKSMSGGVRIGIPPRTRLDLDANTLSGRVSLPSPGPGDEPPEREMGVKVRLVSGNLRIDRVD
jgi:Putative adhesin